MINTNELKAEFARNGLTQKQVAEAIGISDQTLRRRISSGVFGSDEIEKLIKLLDIKDPMKIFFADSVT